MEVEKTKSGMILHMQRLSTEDGPGIRTTVFMKGCPLRCSWCHNPESLSSRPQVQWIESRCIACGTCVDACPNGCIHMTTEGIVIDRERCQGCGTCAQECPTTAMELLGRRITSTELLEELVKDRTFFETSGGGITISGGEPLLQADFVADVLYHVKEEGIHTALDTCGFCSTENLEMVLPHVDLILFDLKLLNAEKHKEFTRQENQRILSNLFGIRDFILSTGTKRLWIRTPLIPGATATEENISSIGQWISQELDGAVDRWELCAFNNLCKDKYRRLSMDWRYMETPLFSEDELRHWERCARQSGVDPAIVIATGATAVQPA